MKKARGFRWVIIIAIVAIVMLIVYGIVHYICSYITMGPFLVGEKNGKWYVQDDGTYMISAKNFGFMEFYGEVHIERAGSNRVYIGYQKEQPPTCCLFAWRHLKSTDFGLMITTVPGGQGIVYYLVLITEQGDYIPEGNLSSEQEAYVRTYIDSNKAEIINLISKYYSVGGLNR